MHVEVKTFLLLHFYYFLLFCRHFYVKFPHHHILHAFNDEKFKLVEKLSSHQHMKVPTHLPTVFLFNKTPETSITIILTYIFKDQKQERAHSSRVYTRKSLFFCLLAYYFIVSLKSDAFIASISSGCCGEIGKMIQCS